MTSHITKLLRVILQTIVEIYSTGSRIFFILVPKLAIFFSSEFPLLTVVIHQIYLLIFAKRECRKKKKQIILFIIIFIDKRLKKFR